MAMTGGTPYSVKKEKPNGQNWYVELFVYLKIVSQSTANNTTTCDLGMYVVADERIDWDDWGTNGTSYIGVSGDHKTFTSGMTTSGTKWLVENKRVTVSHNTDGTGSIGIQWHWGVNSDWGHYTGPSGTKTVTLPTIARASVPTVNTTSSGSTIVSTSPALTKVYIQSHTASSTFKHTVKYAIAGLTNQTAGLDADATTGFTNWTSLTPPLSLLNKLTSYSGDRATLTITLNTYTDSTLSTLIGSKDTTFTLTGTGYVEIDNGSSFNNYIAFVDNGTSWDRVVPYIDDGSNWNLY